MLAPLFGIGIGVVHYFSERICLACSPYQEKIASFSAGVSITYLFLILLPEFSIGAMEVSKLLFFSVLFGFIVLHLIEKYLYQHVSESKLTEELSLEDSLVSFLYYFVVGILLVELSKETSLQGILFFIPILLHAAIRTLPLNPTSFTSLKMIVSLSPLAGVFFANYVTISLSLQYLLIGFIIGVLLFTIIRHAVPFGKKGKPLFFVIGFLLYSTVILFTGYL